MFFQDFSGKSGKVRECQGKLLFTMKSQGKIRENFFESNNDFVNSNFLVYLFVFMVMYVVFTFRLTIKNVERGFSTNKSVIEDNISELSVVSEQAAR